MSLIDYINGLRHGKDAHLLERESMRDPFLYDAIDGFDSVEGNHVERIENMQRRILHKNSINRRYTYLSIAASLIILFSIGGYFIFNDRQEGFIAKGKYSEQVPVSEDNAGANVEYEKKNVIEEEEALFEKDKPIIIGQEEQIVSDNMEVALISESAKGELSEEVADADLGIVKDEEMLAGIEGVEDQFQVAGDSIYIAEAAKTLPENTANAEKKEIRTPASSGSGLSQSATGQQKKTATRLETPEPKIGWKDYKKYLKDSLRRPTGGDCAKSKGTVEVTFHIDEGGHPYDFVIGKSLCPDADAEAIRLVKDGSLWTCKSFKRMTVEVKF